MPVLRSRRVKTILFLCRCQNWCTWLGWLRRGASNDRLIHHSCFTRVQLHRKAHGIRIPDSIPNLDAHVDAIKDTVSLPKALLLMVSYSKLHKMRPVSAPSRQLWSPGSLLNPPHHLTCYLLTVICSTSAKPIQHPSKKRGDTHEYKTHAECPPHPSPPSPPLPLPLSVAPQ